MSGWMVALMLGPWGLWLGFRVFMAWCARVANRRDEELLIEQGFVRGPDGNVDAPPGMPLVKRGEILLAVKNDPRRIWPR